jgi:anthranilate synthase component 1
MITCLTKKIISSLDPITLFDVLKTTCTDVKHRILLESSEVNTRKNLKSIILHRSALRIECVKHSVHIQALSRNGKNALQMIHAFFIQTIALDKSNQKSFNYSLSLKDPQNLSIHYGIQHSIKDENERLVQITPIDTLRMIWKTFSHSQTSCHHGYSFFLAGLFSFDCIDHIERLPKVSKSDYACSDYVFYLAEEVIEVNEVEQSLRFFMNIFSGKEQKKHVFDFSRRLSQYEILLHEYETELKHQKNVQYSSIKKKIHAPLFHVTPSDNEYIEQIKSLKKAIKEGDIFQIVPSRTFSLECLDILLSYRLLKKNNPSPYMFYMEDASFILFGSSPESALKYERSTGLVELYPIAGTAPRGKKKNGTIDDDLDKKYEVALKLNQKELCEHMMLVDLARNDISRIALLGSITIPRLLEVDRYSQVMHLVSCVKGKLMPSFDCFHAYQACMNMGTLTGAPKIKATALIRETEKKRRGSYGGAIGYINAWGDMDTCIVIRSAYCQNGMAYIQAGAGIVHGSVPESEVNETYQKSHAVIHAINDANHCFNHSSE